MRGEHVPTDVTADAAAEVPAQLDAPGTYPEEQTTEIFGISARFDSPDALLKAAKSAYAKGYRKMDAYSPIPIHGLSEAIGMTRTWVPFWVLIMGMSGALGGFLMQYIACTYHYPYDIGGRPYFSWPAFVPVTFECGILAAAITAIVTMLLFNGLPRPYHSMFNIKSFERATTDAFFLCIESEDALYDELQTKTFLEKLEPAEVAVVPL